MAWRAINENDILTRLSQNELDIIKNASTIGDPVPRAITMVTELIRGSIASNQSNVMGAEGTIPERLMDAAASLLVVMLYSNNGGMLIDLNETRVKANEAANRLLERVAEGKFAVELPGPVGKSAEDAKGASVELVTKSESPLRREDLAGL